MIYLTAKLQSRAGNHGHQLKDQISAYTISKLFGIKYVHTHYRYLESFAVGFGEPPCDQQCKTIVLKGPHWNGLDLPSATALFEGIKKRYANQDVLISLEDSFRLFPFQTAIFAQINHDLSQKFAKMNKGRKSTLDNEFYNVAVHISRGGDYDEEKYPQHFVSDWWPRFMFDLEYFKNISDQIRAVVGGKILFSVYTERLNSEEIIDKLKAGDVKFMIGPNRDEAPEVIIDNIFFNFVTSDLLVTCNSSFSIMAALYREGRPTIYHPHAHLHSLPHSLPAGQFLATDVEGKFDSSLLKRGNDG